MILNSRYQSLKEMIKILSFVLFNSDFISVAQICKHRETRVRIFSRFSQKYSVWRWRHCMESTNLFQYKNFQQNILLYELIIFGKCWTEVKPREVLRVFV